MDYARIAHHAQHLIRGALADHGCTIEGYELRQCPCGHTVVAHCVICKDPLVLIVHPDWPNCDHARELIPYLIPAD
jgi:hypothetical protein